MPKSASFYFHGSLNDFLQPAKRNRNIDYTFNDNPALKHAIETIGVPHPEVNVILSNGAPVHFLHPLHDTDKIEIYPVSADTEFPLSWSLTSRHIIPEKFILDVHLGKLARLLRLLGFDTRYENNYADNTIVRIAESEQRIVLTRDVNLLKHKSVTTGYWLRSQHAEEQIMEVIKRFSLENSFKPFKRCTACNGLIMPVAKETVLDRLLLKTILYYHDFFECASCKRVYWKGSHYEHMQNVLEKIETDLS